MFYRALTIPVVLFFFILAGNDCLAESLIIRSPDGTITSEIKITDRIYYNLEVDGREIMWFSPISLETIEAGELGNNPVIEGHKESQVTNKIKTVWGTHDELEEIYNQLIINFEGDYSLIFRLYNEGLSYRWKTSIKDDLRILNENAEFRFLENYNVISHVVGDFQTSYEKLYSRMKISDMKGEEFSSLPFLVDAGTAKLLITESDLYDYPGMYIERPDGSDRLFLKGLFPAYPTKWEQGGGNQFNLVVTERADYIAKTTGSREFPWRVIIVAREDKELADNNLVYKLARPAAIETSWIKPGKVTWEWWNAWNLSGVDFESGINTETYKYYIDFAASNNIEYLIMDEGWSERFDLFLHTPDVDMEKIIQYANEKGVKIILWTVWHTLDKQMEKAFAQFEKWGIAGVKVDFIDRDDQIAVEFYERLARNAARHRLLVDYHGCSKPTGLHRTYPNIINYEAVRGNEYNKFANDETPGHNVDIVFTRMATGPMDYTPGAMTNSVEGDFHQSFENPMSYGTRCHQLGMFVVYFAPLQMLCDAPTEYEKYPDILSFLSNVPVSWDESYVVDGKIGEYVVIARRKGNDWYIGGLTNWDEREVKIDLSEFAEGNYIASMFLDGVNANRKASDYKYEQKNVSADQTLYIIMKKGGGFALHLKNLKD